MQNICICICICIVMSICICIVMSICICMVMSIISILAKPWHIIYIKSSDHFFKH